MRIRSRVKLAIAVTVMVLGSLLTQACSRKLNPEKPCGFVQSNELQRVSWKENFPVRFMIHNSVPTEAYGAIRAAMEHWNIEMGKEVFKIEIYGVGGVNEPRQDNVNVIYWMNQWEQDRQSEQARTTIYWTGSRIYEADIRINAAFPFHYPEDDLVSAQGELDQSSIAGVDFKSLMIHELGHAIGLAHREESSSVMQTMLASGVDRRQLSKADLDSVKCEYEQYRN
jgi:hypothetical protein